MPLHIGDRLGPYEIAGLLGAGGMGEVYRAVDTRLERDVAIKVLPEALAEDARYRERLGREAKMLSQLQHPHICTLYDVGSEPSAPFFLVMERLEGETLADRLMRGPVPLEEAAAIGSEIAEAVEAAHRRGLVHRDLKPGNVMLTEHGTKVLDFGLAKGYESTILDADSPTLTVPVSEEGTIAGTVPYMAPEQLEGKPADARTDIWALGAVLYEMATGERPFRGETQASLITSIMNADPEPPSRKRSLTPPRLDQIVQRCFEKDPERRWQSARDLGLEVRALAIEPPVSGVVEEETGARSRRWALGVAAVALVALVSLGGWWAGRSRGDQQGMVAGSEAGDLSLAPATTRAATLVVLPFESRGAGEEVDFAAGITEQIRSSLARIEDVSLIARRSAEEAVRRNLTVAEMGDVLNADYVLDGTVQLAPNGRQVKLYLELSRVVDQSNLWRGEYDESIEHLFAVQSEIAADVARRLDFSLLRQDVHDGTISPQAMRAYLRGIEMVASGPADNLRAIEQFQIAVDIQDDFAQAWAQLSNLHSWVHIFQWDGPAERPLRLESARQAADRAAELAPDLVETHRAFASLHWAEGDVETALRHLEHAMTGVGDDPLTIATWGAIVGRTGNHEVWFEANRRLLAIDPLSGTYNNYLAQALLYHRRYPEAATYAERAVVLDEGRSDLFFDHTVRAWNVALWRGWDAVEVDDWPDDSPFNIIHFTAHLQHGAFEEAVALIDLLPPAGWLDQFGMRTKSFLHAQVAEASGQRDRALELYEQARLELESARELAPRDGRVSATLGLACAELGRKEEAVRYGEEGVALSGPQVDFYTGTQRVFDLAMIFALVGEPDRALDLLEELLEQPTPFSMPYIEDESNFDSLRHHPRYLELESRNPVTGTNIL